MNTYMLLIILMGMAMGLSQISIAVIDGPKPTQAKESIAPVLQETKGRKRIEPKKQVDNACTVELTFNWSDPVMKPIVTPFKVLEKHKGNLVAAQNDSQMRFQRKRVKKAYAKLQKKMEEFKASFALIASDVDSSLDSIIKELGKPAYTPLLKGVRPLLEDIAADSKKIVGKVGALIKQVISEIETNDALKLLIEGPASKKQETIQSK